MSYKTFVNINVHKYGPNQNEEDFKKLLKEAWNEPGMLMISEDEAEFEDNNNNTIENIQIHSKKYPGMILEMYIDGTIEDSNDRRIARIQDGKMETVTAELHFPPFEFIQTDEEKRQSKAAQEAAIGREDLLAVCEKIADEYGMLATGEELCEKAAKVIYDALASTPRCEKYVSAKIRFNGQNETEEVIFAVGVKAEDLTDEEEEKIFFYVENYDALLALRSEKSGEDFVIEELISTFDKL